MASGLSLLPVPGVPEIQPGAPLDQLMLPCLQGLAQAGDVLVLTHKVVSKAEGRVIDLTQITPSAWAQQWAARWARIKHPEKTPIYGYQLPTWWSEAK